MTYEETVFSFLADLSHRQYSEQTTIRYYRHAVANVLPGWLAQQTKQDIAAVRRGEFDQFSELLSDFYVSDETTGSKQASRYIRLFIRDLYIKGILRSNTPLEKQTPWETRTLRLIEQGAHIMLSRETPLPDQILTFLWYCRTDKDLSLFSIYRANEYLEKAVAFYDNAPVQTWNPKSLTDALYLKGLNTVSVRHHINHIKYFADFLVEMSLLKSNPFVNVHLKPKQKPEKKPLNKDERERLLKAPLLTSKRVTPELYQLRDAAILHLLLTTGVRLLEIYDLTVSQVCLPEKKILIRGKGNKNELCKERTVYLENPNTLDILSRYMAYRNSVSQFLFVTANGTQLSKSCYHSLMKEYGKLAGINQPITTRLLRSSFASAMIENGIDPITLKELMGHSSIKTTYRYYIFLTEDYVKKVWKATNPLSDLLGGE